MSPIVKLWIFLKTLGMTDKPLVNVKYLQTFIKQNTDELNFNAYIE